MAEWAFPVIDCDGHLIDSSLGREPMKLEKRVGIVTAAGRNIGEAIRTCSPAMEGQRRHDLLQKRFNT
jgi:hypothetical protein